MAAEGGAAWLTIHGRTRTAGYAPPIYWKPIGRVRQRLGIPVVANGDIWTLADFRRCREETGCCHFMLGRGGFADPRLPGLVAEELGLNPTVVDTGTIDWPTELRRYERWAVVHPGYTPIRLASRLKQWLRLAADRGTFSAFDAVKRAVIPEAVFDMVDRSAVVV